MLAHTVPLLEVKGVGHSYGAVTALDDISLSINDNEFFALLGPSGCGKTTLLRSIAGFETPRKGSILLDGVDLTTKPPHKRSVNLMFQSFALFPHMSVEKNVAYGLEAERLDKTEIRQRVGAVLDTVGLSALAKRRPAKLSGGQRQRVALARAIVKRPRLLLLDEPLSALDRKVRAEMQLELKRMQHELGMTFVVVTHDQDEAMFMADRIAVLNNGRIEQLDTPVGLYTRPASRFVAGFIGAANLLDGVASSTGVQVSGVGEIQASHGLAVGSAVTVVLRPEDIRLVAPEAGQVAATVVDAFFLGGSSTVSAAVAGIAQPLNCTVHAADVASRGARVGLVFDSARAVAVANPDADPAPIAAVEPFAVREKQGTLS
ncbi:ABC transporter ATP-binding protein [Rathayibacter soli]|uniref:ABC transporter ATP-binding protein n=1 Tax=Rathayibacter soli TaxID=3144168 RepID=UPI0027E51FD9|nr:ABC transporter ATP-binding protein [Glaciibacter superstes]